MATELKDVLHLYLPVAVELNNGGSKVYNRTAVAVGNMDDEFRYVTLRMGTGAKAFTHSILLSEKDRIKLMLRPISSMTVKDFQSIREELSVDIWESARSPKLLYSDRPKHVIVLENRIHTNTLRFNDGIVLMKHGYDIHGLIDSKQAIDKTKTATP